MKTEKNVFITDEIYIDQLDSENLLDRYEFTENKEGFIDFIIREQENPETPDEELGKITMEELKEKYPEAYEKWREEAEYEEQYEVPMMNALRYYPDFVHFDEEDRYKVAGNTTLLYDNDKEAWAIGMTGGGMDLAPHLVATFINLGKGVPAELAMNISTNYNAYVNEKVHAENCRLLAKAFHNYADRMNGYARGLEGKKDRAGKNNIEITIYNGVIDDVKGLPEGWTYTLKEEGEGKEAV